MEHTVILEKKMQLSEKNLTVHSTIRLGERARFLFSHCQSCHHRLSFFPLLFFSGYCQFIPKNIIAEIQVKNGRILFFPPNITALANISEAVELDQIMFVRMYTLL
jgi:hypothetical protein